MGPTPSCLRSSAAAATSERGGTCGKGWVMGISMDRVDVCMAG